MLNSRSVSRPIAAAISHARPLLTPRGADEQQVLVLWELVDATQKVVDGDEHGVLDMTIDVLVHSTDVNEHVVVGAVKLRRLIDRDPGIWLSRYLPGHLPTFPFNTC